MSNWHKDYAQKFNKQLNPDSHHVEMILEGLEAKKNKFGARYCPCKLANITENICPCVEFRTAGHCHCQLFMDTE